MKFAIPEREIEVSAVRASGAGGQGVNKVSSAVHLRFDVRRSSLPAWLKARLLALRDQRMTREGVVVIKAQQHRSQDMNREEAVRRLLVLVHDAAVVPKARKETKPSRAAKRRRIEGKIRRGRIKQLRGKVDPER
jgi:ribosome-associated protein